MVRTRASVRHSIVSGWRSSSMLLMPIRSPGRKTIDDLPTAILDRAGARNPTYSSKYTVLLSSPVLTKTSPSRRGRRPHSLPECRLATDQQIAQLRTV